MTVYLIHCEINGRCYVGKTIRKLSERWHEHCRDARNFRKTGDLYADLRLHGRESFTVCTLGETHCSRRLAQMERKFIRLHRAAIDGYNQDEISHGGRIRVRTTRTRTLTEEQKRRIAESVSRYRQSQKAQSGNSEVAA